MKKQAEEFLTIFNEIEEKIKDMTNTKEYNSFNSAIRKGAKQYSSINHHKDDLKIIKNLRNHIVHNNNIIAEPNNEALNLIKKVKSNIIKPPKAEKLNSDVKTIKSNESLLTAIKIMKENDYSQLPIVNENNDFVDLLTDNAISRWLGKQDNREGGILIDNNQIISEVFKYKEDTCFYDFITRKENLYEVINIYNEIVKKGKRFDALLITENGKEKEKIMGIITSWDIPRIYEMI